MGAIWSGGEDISFPIPVTWPGKQGAGGAERTGYSRCTVQADSLGTGSSESPLHFCSNNPFQGGPVTDCWWSFRTYTFGNVVSGPMLLQGLCSSGVGISSGLWITVQVEKLGLYTYNGTTATKLAEESGSTLTKDVPHRIDIQIVNFGATATVLVFNDFVLAITFTGDVGISGAITNIDTVCLMGHAQQGLTNFAAVFAEIQLDTRDLRASPGVFTKILNGAGDLDEWNGVYSTINQATFSDAAPNYTDVTAKKQEFVTNSLPAITCSIAAINTEIRVGTSSTPSVTQVKMGWKSGGSVAFGTGSTKTPGTVYGTSDQLDDVNPVTTNPWLQAEVDPAQPTLESLT